MKKYTKYIVVAALVATAGLGTYALTRNGSDGDTVQNQLYPEKTISHGHGLSVDVRDSSKVYIATHYGLLVLQNEKDLYRVGKSRDDYMGFSPHPTDSKTFFTSGHPSRGGNIGFQRSDDGGFTWKKVANGVNGPVDFHAMAVSPVNPNLVFGWYQGNVQRSTDQGKTWEIVNRDVLAVYLAADSGDENVVYAATPRGEGVMVSRDKGANWSSLSKDLEGGMVSVIAVHPNSAKILLTFSEKLGGLGKSSDGGQTWKKVNSTFNGETILHIAFDSSKPEIAYGLTEKNSLYKSVDTGETWNKIR